MIMGDLTKRAAQLRWCDGEARYRNGSGYLVAPDLVLTAAHVVRGAEKVQVKLPLRDGSERDWRMARVCWRAEDPERSDLALVQVQAPYESVSLARFAHPGTAAGRVPFTGIGFPAFKCREEAGVAPLRDTAELYGVLVRGEDRKTGVLALHLRCPPPLDTSQEPYDGSVWAGVSGAAVVCGSCVVGVVRSHPLSEGPLTLEAVPIHRVLGERGFCAALTGGNSYRPVRWDDPWGVLGAPYQEMPPYKPSDANSLANLLRAELAVVPFQECEEFDELRSWLTLEQQFGGWVLHGPSGAGKTRLAAQIAEGTGRDGWLTGFLPGRFDAERLEPLLASGLRLLIVVDEAHSWHTEDLAGLLEALAERKDARTRVLLLARGEGQHEGEWYTRLRNHAAARLPVGRAIASTSVRALTPVDVEHRAAAFRTAADAFAAATHAPGRTMRVPDLSDPAFEQILAVHLHALRAALSGEDDYDDASPLAGPLDWLLDRERDYWHRRERDYWHRRDDEDVSGARDGLGFLRERDAQVIFQEQAVGLAALMRAHNASEDRARRILKSHPRLSGKDRKPLRQACDDWLRSLYPGAGRWPPLKPDLVADHLIAQLAADGGDFIQVLERLPGLADQAQLENAIDVLARVARTHPDQGKPAALEVFAAGPGIVLPIAITVAERTGDPFGPLIDQHLRERPNPPLAAQLEALLPKETVTLREAAVTIIRQARDHLGRHQHGAGQDAEIARLDNSLARWLISLERADEAMADVEEAVAIRRRVADGELAGDQAHDFLAMSLSNKANCLTQLGRRNEALAAIQEAVAIRQRPADTFKPGLAASLITMAGCLNRLRRYEEGLAAIEKAVTTYRQLAADRPDPFESDLAIALTSQSISLRELGRHKDALASIDEAVALHRRLAEARPDVFLENFAISLNNQAACLGELGRLDDALTAAQETVRIRRRLAAIRPDAFLPGLALALINLSEAMAGMALKTIEESVSIHRRLLKKHPDTYTGFLVESLSTQSNRLSERGYPGLAHQVITEAIEFALPVLEQDPHLLRDPARYLLQPYLDLCERVQRPPDAKIVTRMKANVIVTGSGVGDSARSAP